MKRCPFCAEEIQDAAIVCKHCRRDLPPPPLPTPTQQSRRTPTPFQIGFVIFAGVVIVGIVAQQWAQWEQRGQAAGPCRLHARAALVTRDMPIAQLGKWTTDVLAIRGTDATDWLDLEVTIWGFVNTPATGKQASGPYRLTKGFVGAGQLTAMSLNDFQNANGQHWISLTMEAEDVHLKAGRCEADVALTEPGEVIGR